MKAEFAWRMADIAWQWSKRAAGAVARLYRALPAIGIVRAYLVDLGVVVVMLVLFGIIAKELLDTSPIADPFSIPASLAAAGYSPEVVAERLIARSRAIEAENNASKDGKSAAASKIGGSDPLGKVTLPSSGVSVAAVVAAIRQFLGLPSIHIGGAIVVHGSADAPVYTMTVWVRGRSSVTRTDRARSSIEEAIEHGARALTGLLRPCALAAHLLGDPDADEWLDDCFRDPSRRDIEWAFNLRGLRFFAQERYDEAIPYFLEALALSCDYRNARENLIEALRRNTEGPSATR